MNRHPIRRTTASWRHAAIRLLAAVLLLALAVPAASVAREDFKQVSGPCDFVFPGDHGPHPEYRTEWWYYTGNLTGEDGRRFGFQLTFFRSGLTPPAARDQWPTRPSAWRSDTIYLAHAAITDIDNGRHLQAEKAARPVLSMAGAREENGAWTIHVDNWQAVIANDRQVLAADAGGFSLQLDLTPAKPLVRHGNGGYSRKGQAPEHASCYYSYTRLQARGRISLDGRDHNVDGTSWMDHEFSTAPLAPGIVGWDWFSLQLSDDSEVMVFILRQADGGLNPASSGTYVMPSGETRHLAAEAIRITPVDWWKSPRSAARYPVQWEIALAGPGLVLKIDAEVADQEMHTPQSTGITYWEGSVNSGGTKNGKPVEGRGYVEMTGYAQPMGAGLQGVAQDKPAP